LQKFFEKIYIFIVIFHDFFKIGHVIPAHNIFYLKKYLIIRATSFTPFFYDEPWIWEKDLNHLQFLSILVILTALIAKIKKKRITDCLNLIFRY